MKENPKHTANWIKMAFEAGFHAALDEEKQPEAWNNSTAKQVHDLLLREAQGGVNVQT